MFHSIRNDCYEPSRSCDFQLIFLGIFSIWCVCGGPCHYNIPPSTPLSISFFDTVFHSIGDAMFHSVVNNHYESSRLFDFGLIFFGIISIWCVCGGSCHYNVSPSTAISILFFDAVCHSICDAMFHCVVNKRYESSGLFVFRVILWNNFDMMWLLWSMSSQCPTFYSPINFSFSTLCFIASVTLCFIASGITAANHRDYLIFRWFFSNNLNMLCLWWSMSLQCPTFYSPIKFLFSMLCFLASVMLCFITSGITAINHHDYLIFSWFPLE